MRLVAVGVVDGLPVLDTGDLLGREEEGPSAVGTQAGLSLERERAASRASPLVVRAIMECENAGSAPEWVTGGVESRFAWSVASGSQRGLFRFVFATRHTARAVALVTGEVAYAAQRG